MRKLFHLSNIVCLLIYDNTYRGISFLNLLLLVLFNCERQSLVRHENVFYR